MTQSVQFKLLLILSTMMFMVNSQRTTTSAADPSKCGGVRGCNVNTISGDLSPFQEYTYFCALFFLISFSCPTIGWILVKFVRFCGGGSYKDT
mmetsp:Transcript_1719/g.2370  ORF Transcript_1719/g.2370 Transcript_1719/m.2370 type:complete len:93 (-) Transcript_1719:427-705(-)